MKYATSFDNAVAAPPTAGPWAQAHNEAIRTFLPPMQERGIIELLRGWYNYAIEYDARFRRKIGTDYVLGSAWFEIGSALLRMLNGELGRLDGGTLDRFVRQTMFENGFEQNMVDDA